MNKIKDYQKMERWVMITIIILLIAITSVSLFYTSGGKPTYFLNQYNEQIKIYGDGIYKNDSYFMSTIFRGTDFIFLVLISPLLILTFIYQQIKKSKLARLTVISFVSVIHYYSYSLLFGVIYNQLFLLYIFLFSTTFFYLLFSIHFLANSFDRIVNNFKVTKGISLFLIVCSIALFVAWLPDVITALLNNHPLSVIQNYTTNVTYIIDMAIISPLMILCLHLIKKQNNYGYILYSCLLMLCTGIGIILISQTIFQSQAGIEIPFEAFLSKIGSFVLLSVFSAKLQYNLYKLVN